MQKLILSIIFIFSFSFVGLSQNALSKLSEEQIKTAISHKWKLSFLEGKGKKIKISDDKATLFLGFNSDGKLYESDGKKEYYGTWTYNHSSFTITTNDKDGIEKHVIIDVSNDQLILKSKFRGIPFNMGLQKVN